MYMYNLNNRNGKKKILRSSIAILPSTLDIIIQVRVNFSTRILPFPVRFDELPGSRNGQGSSALSRREHARDSGPITRLAHYRSAVEWQVRREERARRAHAAACTHTRTPVSLHPKEKSGGERLTIGDDVSVLSSSSLATDSRSSCSCTFIYIYKHNSRAATVVNPTASRFV